MSSPNDHWFTRYNEKGGVVMKYLGDKGEDETDYGLASQFRIVRDVGPGEFWVVFWRPQPQAQQDVHTIHVMNAEEKHDALWLDTDQGLWIVQEPVGEREAEWAADKAMRARFPEQALEQEQMIVRAAGAMVAAW